MDGIVHLLQKSIGKNPIAGEVVAQTLKLRSLAIQVGSILLMANKMPSLFISTTRSNPSPLGSWFRSNSKPAEDS